MPIINKQLHQKVNFNDKDGFMNSNLELNITVIQGRLVTQINYLAYKYNYYVKIWDKTKPCKLNKLNIWLLFYRYITSSAFYW